MIKIIDYAVPSPKQFQLAVRGVRFSWGSNGKSDSYGNKDFYLGNDDKTLLLKPINAGASHSKFLRQLPLAVDLIGPQYWWREMDTYRIGCTRNSSSQMHTAGSRPFELSDFSFDVTENANVLLDYLNGLRDNWISSGKKKYDNPYWRAMLQAIPQSFNYRSVLSMNYQVAKQIYQERRNHRLAEWRDFCNWITELPLSELIMAE